MSLGGRVTLSRRNQKVVTNRFVRSGWGRLRNSKAAERRKRTARDRLDGRDRARPYVTGESHSSSSSSGLRDDPGLRIIAGRASAANDSADELQLRRSHVSRMSRRGHRARPMLKFYHYWQSPIPLECQELQLTRSRTRGCSRRRRQRRKLGTRPRVGEFFREHHAS